MSYLFSVCTVLYLLYLVIYTGYIYWLCLSVVFEGLVCAELTVCFFLASHTWAPCTVFTVKHALLPAATKMLV